MDKWLKPIIKGRPGYIEKRKKRYLLFAVTEFAVVLAVLLTGIIATRTRLNVMTVAAVVGCLPASKMLVEYLVMVPFHSIEKKRYQEVEEAATELTTCYDLLASNSDKLMNVEAMVITSHVVCGYTSTKNADCSKMEVHLKQVLAGEGYYDRVTVRILTDYRQFLKRAEGLNEMAKTDRSQNPELERKMAEAIQITCM